jgi:hypothetical protein
MHNKIIHSQNKAKFMLKKKAINHLLGSKKIKLN